MNYKSIQCISLSLGTGSDEPKYEGIKNDTTDWQHRIAFMNDAINTSQKSKELKSDPACLKIFMAPEFFFRGTKGAYDLETATKISEELTKMVKDEKYKDWLFVFGTTVAYYETTGKSATKYNAVNFSLIQNGGKDEKDSYLVLKRYLSTIDFLKKSSDPEAILDKDVQYISENSRILNEKRIANYDGTCFFERDGIRFGVEICADNLAHRIDHSNHRDGIDVLLVPSCGRPNPTLGRHLDETGILFAVDGAFAGKSRVQKGGVIPFLNSVRMKNVSVIPNNGQFYSDAKVSISKPVRILNREREKQMDQPLLQKLIQNPNNKSKGIDIVK